MIESFIRLIGHNFMSIQKRKSNKMRLGIQECVQEIIWLLMIAMVFHKKTRGQESPKGSRKKFQQEPLDSGRRKFGSKIIVLVVHKTVQRHKEEEKIEIF